MMTYMNNTRDERRSERRGEQGNVLFLILIAVALFAALSYAVTQSTRSGGGDANKETTLVNSSQITQYPAGIKTAITRMIISNNVTSDQLLFDGPSNFSTLETNTVTPQGVFYPTGGGATYSDAPSSVMAGGTPGVWHFNAENQVTNIGTTAGAPSTSSNDIIAFLPGVSKAICDRIHAQLGLGAVPAVAAVDFTTDMDYANSGIPVAPGGATITDAVLDGQPQGCFIDGGTTYVYYHVLVER